jgi:hypothetical protein
MSAMATAASRTWKLFVPAALILVLAWWPFVVPQSHVSLGWLFYLTVPLSIAAFIALIAGIAIFTLRKLQ